MITVSVTDNRPERDPQTYTLDMPDNCSVVQFLGLVSDGADNTETLTVSDKSGAKLALGEVLENGDTLTINV